MNVPVKRFDDLHKNRVCGFQVNKLWTKHCWTLGSREDVAFKFGITAKKK